MVFSLRNTSRFWLNPPTAAKKRKARLGVTQLEGRSVPAAATAVFTASTGTLTVEGGTAPDDINDDLSVELISGKVDVKQDGTSLAITDGVNPVNITLAMLKGIVVNAGAGNDTVFIFAAINKPATLNGGAGDDALTGGSGNDVINGEDDVDMLFGGKGNDVINAGDGDGQNLDGGFGNDSLTGGAEGDDIYGGFGNDTINAGSGDDRLRGDDPTDRKGGNDTINGDDGNDTIVSGRGNDNINGGNGNDVIEAGDGNDTVTSGPDDVGTDLDADADSIYGGTGNDLLKGGWGRDLIYGEAGNDSLIGGAGDDNLSGGIGIDSFIGHGTPIGLNVGLATDLDNFDTYRDEFNLSRPINGKAEVKDIAITELGIQAALAGMAAVANNSTNFKIAGRIRYLGTGDYLVKLGQDDDSNPATSGNTDPFGWVPVHFDGTWTDNDPRPNAQERFNPKKDAREFWTILLHRAVTQSLDGSYDPFAHYSQSEYDALDTALTNSADFIQQMTGMGADGPIAYNFNDLRTSLPLGIWFTAKAGAAPVVANQFYAITKVSIVLGVNYVTLYNPSGFDQGAAPATPTATLDQLGKPVEDGSITLRESEFTASFTDIFKN